MVNSVFDRMVSSTFGSMFDSMFDGVIALGEEWVQLLRKHHIGIEPSDLPQQHLLCNGCC